MLPTGSRPLKPPLILQGKQCLQSLRHQARPVKDNHAAGKGPAYCFTVVMKHAGQRMMSREAQQEKEYQLL